MFFRKQKPTINFVPAMEALAENVPVQKASDVLPTWWKDIKPPVKDPFFVGSASNSNSSIKRCPGIMDILKHGWIIPAWCDIAIKVNGRIGLQWKFSDSRFFASCHTHDQFLDHVPEYIRKKYFWVLKLHNPWSVVTSPGYSTIHIDPFYHFNEFFDTASGIQETDYYHDTNIFLYIKKEGSFIIERGTPLVILYPYKREEIVGIVEKYNKERFTKLKAFDVFRTFSKFNHLKSYRLEQYKKGKCPFHTIN
jgi:hypothetical protein